MADNQFARSGVSDRDLLSDDDPLSELARIVGFDARPASQQLAELKKHQEALDERPAFDLEAELLAEFDTYAAPSRQVSPVASVAAPATFAPVPSETPTVVGVDEPWPFKEAATRDAPATVPPLDMPAAAYSDYDVSDLERELELSIQSAEAAERGNEAGSAHQTEFKIDDGIAAPVSIAGPEADVVDQVAEAVAAETPVPDAGPLAETFPADEVAPVIEPVEDTGVVEPLRQPVMTSQADTVPVVEQTNSPSQGAVDHLLAEVERFPVPPSTRSYGSAAAVPVVGQRKSNYPFVPTFGRATPTAAAGSMATIRPSDTPVAMPPVPVAIVAPPEPEADLQAESDTFPTVAEPFVSPVAEVEPEIDLDNFELDLSDMELDLDPAELDLTTQETLSIRPDTDGRDAFVETTSPAYAVANDRPSAQDFIDDDLIAQEMFEQDLFEPAEEAPSEAELHFDPSMISETDEAVSHLADLDIPQLPPVEQDRPTVQEPDYDLDIDAEMAHLFDAARGRPETIDIKRPADTAAENHARFAPVTHGHAQPTSKADDFAEFERVMEEDFRRSLRERQEGDLSVERQPVQPGYAEMDDLGESRQRRRRILALAACVAGIALLGGAGVYAFMGSSAGGSTSSAPKIILADKDPIKVVPVEKGGKTVPNQDKAVYDRVAGATEDNPQQEALVSSTEEPIDVVQRTLTPESLPLEGGDEFETENVATPIDNQESARLFPEESASQTTTEDKTPAVSPRKVKTMIVKPDGTLVAREEPVAVPETAVLTETTATLPETASATPTDDEAQAPLSEIQPPVAASDAADTVDTALRTTPETETPVTEATSEPTAIEDAASADVGETAPVRVVTTSTISGNAPVPQSRPADQPVNVVGTITDQGNVTEPATSRVGAEVETQKPATTEVASVQSTPVAAGSYVVQIASLPSEAEAQRSYNSLSGKFSGVIGGRGVDIRKAEISGKGTYFRVRIPAGSREEANALCAKLKSAGGSCLVTK